MKAAEREDILAGDFVRHLGDGPAGAVIDIIDGSALVAFSGQEKFVPLNMLEKVEKRGESFDRRAK